MKNIFNILFFFSFTAYAQLGKEAWNWEFACKKTLTFNMGVINSGSCNICAYKQEGCASVSDVFTGKLLFYTDGTTAWDKNNNPMPNGGSMIGGYGTSTQAALIIPKPCYGNLYYIISADQGGYYGSANTGVHYSIVDMNLNGGLGNIVFGSKNLVLTPPPTTEKLVGVKHGNGKDYWIITHPLNSNAYNSYLVNSNGIDTTPIVSYCGGYMQGVPTVASTAGYLKASPDGKKLAAAYTSGFGWLEIYDFDNLTGLVTNPLAVSYPLSYEPYGVSFSPDNKKLYVGFLGNSYVFQYDLSSGVDSIIVASTTTITSTANYIGAMQIAPDGKIYAAPGDSNKLFVINNPNNLGLACNFQISNFKGYGYGLPNFIDGGLNYTNPFLFNRTIDTSVCIGTPTLLTANNGFSNYMWSTGDTTQSIKVNTSGLFTVKCTDSKQCIVYDTFKTVLHSYPKVDLGKDTTICSGSTLLSIANHNASCLWSTGQTNNSIYVSKPGSYWVNVNLNNCVSSDTINIYSDTNHIHISYPNIITPNGDNINDFINFGNDAFTYFHLEIFNRWGKKIFISDDTYCIWYPDEDNEIIDAGTCYYIINYSLSCGTTSQSKTLKGFITVVK